MRTEWRDDVSPVLRKNLALIPRRERIWNGWCRYIPKEDGCIIHAWEEGVTPRGRAICGAPVTDSGALNLTESTPGCIRCRRILIKSGLLEENDYR